MQLNIGTDRGAHGAVMIPPAAVGMFHAIHRRVISNSEDNKAYEHEIPDNRGIEDDPGIGRNRNHGAN